MAYTNKIYFLTKIKETALNNLLLNDAETVQESYLDDAIAAADNLIDSYLRKKISTVPLSPVPEIIKQYSYYIATYYLHDRIQYNDIPDRVRDNYDLSLNFLKDFSAGRAELEGIVEGGEETQIDYTSLDNVFDRSTF